jgi:hypothetical protein
MYLGTLFRHLPYSLLSLFKEFVVEFRLRLFVLVLQTLNPAEFVQIHRKPDFDSGPHPLLEREKIGTKT